MKTKIKPRSAPARELEKPAYRQRIVPDKRKAAENKRLEKIATGADE